MKMLSINFLTFSAFSTTTRPTVWGAVSSSAPNCERDVQKNRRSWNFLFITLLSLSHLISSSGGEASTLSSVLVYIRIITFTLVMWQTGADGLFFLICSNTYEPRETRDRKRWQEDRKDEELRPIGVKEKASSTISLIIVLSSPPPSWTPFIISSSRCRTLSYGADTMKGFTSDPQSMSPRMPRALSVPREEGGEENSCSLQFVWPVSRTFNQSFHGENSERNWIRSWALNHAFLIDTGLVHIDLGWLESLACVAT